RRAVRPPGGPGRRGGRFHDRVAGAQTGRTLLGAERVARVGRALAVAGLALPAALGSVGGRLGTSRADDAPVPSQPRTLRVVTFNLLHAGIFSEATGDDQALETGLRLATDGLRALSADVVGLQEASVGRRRGHIAARLAEAL